MVRPDIGGRLLLPGGCLNRDSAGVSLPIPRPVMGTTTSSINVPANTGPRVAAAPTIIPRPAHSLTLPARSERPIRQPRMLQISHGTLGRDRRYKKYLIRASAQEWFMPPDSGEGSSTRGMGSMPLAVETAYRNPINPCHSEAKLPGVSTMHK